MDVLVSMAVNLIIGAIGGAFSGIVVQEYSVRRTAKTQYGVAAREVAASFSDLKAYWREATNEGLFGEQDVANLEAAVAIVRDSVLRNSPVLPLPLVEEMQQECAALRVLLQGGRDVDGVASRISRLEALLPR